MQPTIALSQSLRLVNQILRRNLIWEASEKTFGRRLKQILKQSADKLSNLPLLTCEAVGGDPHQAIPLIATWQLLRLSAKLLDDLADGENVYSSAETIDLATSLLFLGPLALEELRNLGVPADRVERLTQSLYQAGLCACAAQHAEFTSQSNMDPDSWLAVARAKSGNPCGWAAWSGAVITGAGEQVLSDFHNFGLHLGILLQIADDFNGVWQPLEFSDLRDGRLNLAVCYARLVAEGEPKHHLEVLLKNATDGDGLAENEIRQFLIKIGSQAYLLIAGGEQRQHALAALQRNHRSYPALVGLLDQIWPILAEEEADAGHHVEKA